MPVFKNLIEQIVVNHKGTKGIIHTHNMNITNYMRENLKGKRYLVREDGIDNEQILQMHLQGENDTVLVSPSMTHGVDLKDDLARFQIIVKAPYLPLNSKRIKKLFDMDSQWYANKMLTTVIQASGRGVRSKDDFCVTYILDGNIVHSILDNASRLPKYFLKRFV
jgi:Rad3-related DNA helicase